MLNSAFGAFTEVDDDFYPADLRAEIDRINDLVYSHFNNGVYRAGFARGQEAYEEAARKVFVCLDEMDDGLSDGVTSRASVSPKPTGARLRYCASTRFTTATSNATCAGSRTIRIWRITCASSPVAGDQRHVRFAENQRGLLQPAQRQSDGDRPDRADSRSFRITAQPTACLPRRERINLKDLQRHKRRVGKPALRVTRVCG